jgi:hypothetical protein
MTAKKKIPAKKGRQTKYNPDYHPLAAWTLAIKGMGDKEISKELRISTATLASWKNIYPDFLSLLKDGKGIANAKVEHALFKRAIGYKFKKKKKTLDVFGNAKTEVSTEHVVPDVTAQIFWLNKRNPQDWPAKQEIEHSGTVTWKELIESASRK